MEYLKFNATPSGKAEGKKHIIIVGAGIIGVCTAYFIITHPKFDSEKYHITLIESKRIAGGASGKAGGLLALWAFPSQIVPLSFNLHQELADKYDGAKEWGYRRLTTVSLEGDISGVNEEDLLSEDEQISLDTKLENSSSVTSSTISTSNSQNSKNSSDSSSSEPQKKFSRRSENKREMSNKANNAKKILPNDLNWINSALINNCSTLGSTDTTGQVHPYKFTNFILKKAVELSNGSLELVLGKVEEMIYSEESESVIGVKFKPTSQNLKNSNSIINLLGDQIVMTVGPWTSKILPDCPISGLRAHSITIAPFKDQPVSPYAIFTEFKTNSNNYISPEIYARSDEVYVCGEGDSTVDVPETTDDVEVVTTKCDELFNQVSKFSPNLRKGHILKKQACYLPVLDVPTSSGPLIGETNVDNLFLCSGHSCWGINNAPGSGKIMSELLLDGKCKSAKIQAFNPSLYFDASIMVGDDDE
ncbi:putative oxidoreductase Tda3p [[Candida] jaroonii]|uniref:Oxidoreductase Tda3p n=1 Tax=[Candida] jaroonii TaxID=467808 RepID=A0ACA9Y6A4_9ASCO|nr:putative oxidoreductase Tda3p [[Candida] jaroonii]